MKRSIITRSGILMTLVMAMILIVSTAAGSAETKKTNSEPTFLRPIKSPQAWYTDQVAHGHDIYFSANYIFQASKLRTQQVLVDYELASMYPALQELMADIKQGGVNGSCLVFVEMARKLLDPHAKIDPTVSEEVSSRLELFRKDPQNFPRGRYASSEELKRYFQAVQFLTKATFDVKVDKTWFATRNYMLFPFEAAVELLTKLANRGKQASPG